MSQKHLFGRPLTVLFRPQADDEDVSAYSLTSARIYDEYPTDAQIENSATGHLDEAVTWTAEAVGVYSVAFDALTDSEPHSASEYEKYFVVFNFKYESGGADHFDVETIFVYRPDSHTSEISVTSEDVYKLESRLEDVAPTLLWAEDKIAIASQEVIAILEVRGYKKRRIFNWEKLNLTVARWAARLCCEDLAAQGSQFWATKADRWKESAERMFEAAIIGYDIVGDDNPTSPEETKFSGAVAVLR